MNKSGIYKILNKVNGKFYIGSAVNFRKRWDLHRCHLRNNKHDSRHLQAAWNKYGEENFEFIILELVDIKNLYLVEQKYIDDLKCFEHSIGYNICKSVVNGRLGIKSTPEHIAKIVMANTGQKRSKETCERIGAAKKGTILSEDQKQARRDYRHTDEAKQKIADRKGWTHSEQAKLKMSEARKETTRRKNQEFFANMAAPL